MTVTQTRAWRAANPDKARAASRNWNRENRGRVRATTRAWEYRTKYGITIADYDRMFAEQGGRCKICAGDNPGQRRTNFLVDHCHATGKVRGLLCVKCNTRLAWVEKHGAAVAAYLGK